MRLILKLALWRIVFMAFEITIYFPVGLEWSSCWCTCVAHLKLQYWVITAFLKACQMKGWMQSLKLICLVKKGAECLSSLYFCIHLNSFGFFAAIQGLFNPCHCFHTTHIIKYWSSGGWSWALKTDFWNDDMKDVRSIIARVSKCSFSPLWLLILVGEINIMESSGSSLLLFLFCFLHFCSVVFIYLSQLSSHNESEAILLLYLRGTRHLNLTASCFLMLLGDLTRCCQWSRLQNYLHS